MKDANDQQLNVHPLMILLVAILLLAAVSAPFIVFLLSPPAAPTWQPAPTMSTSLVEIPPAKSGDPTQTIVVYYTDSTKG